jgi:hypothetical protein
MEDESMSDNKHGSFPKERWGEWIIVIILFLSGTALYFASPLTTGLFRQALTSISLSFLSTSFATGIILAIVGSDVRGLRKEIDKLHNIIDEKIEIIQGNSDNQSAFLRNTYSLGIIGLGRSRQSANFEGNKNFLERWKYFLENAHEVDVICFADRSLFNYEVFDIFFIEKIKERMEQRNEKGLKLRIILTSLDNLYNKEINEWSRTPRFMENRILDARDVLKRLCGVNLNPDVVREHKSFVPFTLLRGDNYIYIMYFIPGYTGGPVLEIRPVEMITYPITTNMDDEKNLFRIYRSYFEDVWQRHCKPIISVNSDTSSNP